MSTTITLSDSMLHDLAVDFAETIHAQIIRRHLKRTGFAEPHTLGFPARDISKIRSAVLSIDNTGGYCSARRDFIATVKWALKVKCKEKRTERRWQTYVARVAELNNQPHPGAPDAPDWTNFILRQRPA